MLLTRSELILRRDLHNLSLPPAETKLYSPGLVSSRNVFSSSVYQRLVYVPHKFSVIRKALKIQCNKESSAHNWHDIFSVKKALKILVGLYMLSLISAVITGIRYFLQLCQDDKSTLLMLQVGVSDNTQELPRELDTIAEIADTSDGLKLKEVVKALLQHYKSCHFAYHSINKCICAEKKYGDDFAEMMYSIHSNPPALFKAYFIFKGFLKSLAATIHWALKKAIKKIKYGDKCSEQLLGEVLSRELVRYDRDEEAVGNTHSMVDNDYLVVTILVLASGTYSIPPLECNTEHVKTVLQKFNTIPENKVESVKVLLKGVSEQDLQRDFPVLKLVN